MIAYVVIATRGRPSEVKALIRSLINQTVPPSLVLISCVDEEDCEIPAEISGYFSNRFKTLYSEKSGLTVQRNLALDFLKRNELLREDSSYVVFLDDDFRPASDWLECAGMVFQSHPEVVGITGRVLADGVKGDPIDEATAAQFLAGQNEPTSHWASGMEIRDLDCVYGCNMAWRSSVASTLRFDEKLPAYGWQEDRDYTGRALKLGRVIYVPGCKGVHLGARNGRSSGLRLGYSQIINPIYLCMKGSVRANSVIYLVGRSFLSNLSKSFRAQGSVDYRGRFRGNILAILHLLTGRIEPWHIDKI